MSDQQENDGNKVFHYEGGVPVFDSALDEIKLEQAKAKERDEKYKNAQLSVNQQQLEVNRRLMRFTGILVLCTAVTGVISAYAAYVAKVSADAAKNAATTAQNTFDLNKQYAADALNETRNQVRLQSSSNDTNREALTAVQRPFLTLVNVNGRRSVPLQGQTPDHFWMLEAQFLNNGVTAAEGVVQDYHFGVLPNGEPDDKTFLILNGAPNQWGTTTIGPKATHSMGGVQVSEKEMFGQDLGDAFNGPVWGKFYAWGWVSYRDGFKGTERHLTEYCQPLVAYATRRFSPNMVGMELTFGECQKHNCTDKSCPDYESVMKLVPRSIR